MFDKNFNQDSLNNELIEAVMKSDITKVRKLFSQEPVPFIDTEINGIPAIMYAAQHKNWDLVEEFYNLGADLDAKVPYLQWYLLHECIKSAPDRVTKAIIDYCNVNAQTKDGKTAIMIAIEENKIAMAEYLIDSGKIDLSLTDKKHNNAAHYAAKNLQYDLLIKLIQTGTPINKKNLDGKTPIDLISDVSFKENLPKVLGELAKIDKTKNNLNTVIKEETKIIQENQEKKEEIKPKVSGLSSIKRRL